MKENDKIRLGLLPALAEQAAAGHIGRTALMKYMYFLQVLRGVPLGYNFSLYSYGPFDSDVLADLSSAEALNIVDVTPVEFPGGYGYRIRPGARSEAAKRSVGQFLEEHRGDIDWLFASFGSLNSSELELASTIVYVDREFGETRVNQAIEEVVTRVSEIKPHFTQGQIRTFAETLLRQGVLTSITRGSRSAVC
jgi:hypothetical protein